MEVYFWFCDVGVQRCYRVLCGVLYDGFQETYLSVTIQWGVSLAADLYALLVDSCSNVSKMQLKFDRVAAECCTFDLAGTARSKRLICANFKIR